jgi:hypothetical protein
MTLINDDKAMKWINRLRHEDVREQEETTSPMIPSGSLFDEHIRHSH